ncbi:MAG: phosphoglycerate kinase, partial [Actinobacteria bacterium]|nr:phosphoglycerate kinase [Actinomycetota bacterium]
MQIKNLNQIELKGKRIVLRCDLNVPIKNGVIEDDGRIRASLSTIDFLLKNNCSIVVIAHLGRPKGEIKAELSLQPVAKALGRLLGREVSFNTQIRGLKSKTELLKPSEILMLENIRFEKSETSKVPSERLELAKELASYGQIYVGDGFGAV